MNKGMGVAKFPLLRDGWSHNEDGIGMQQMYDTDEIDPATVSVKKIPNLKGIQKTLQGRQLWPRESLKGISSSECPKPRCEEWMSRTRKD